MKKVYIVSEYNDSYSDPYEEILKIFADEYDAEAFADKIRLDLEEGMFVSVSEYDVE